MNNKPAPEITPQLAISAYHVLQQYCLGSQWIAKAVHSTNTVQNVFKAYHAIGTWMKRRINMKPEKAINILQKRIDLIDTEYPDQKDLMEYRGALECAVKALKEQQEVNPIGWRKMDKIIDRAAR